METNLNKLLTRQIKRHFGSIDNLPNALEGFIQDINETYNDFDDDTLLIQNSIEISSQELRDAFQKQKHAVEKQSETIRKIKDAIAVLNSTEHNEMDEIDSDSSDSSYLFDSLIKLIEKNKQDEIELVKLKIAVEQSSSTVVITDLNGNIQYTNRKFEETTGYTPDEALGKNPRILKSDETGPEKYKELWNTILAGNEWHGEFHNKRKDGSLYWEYASISPIRNSAGEITSFLGVKEDITERKKIEVELKTSEENFRTFFSSIADLLFVLDSNGNIIDVNETVIKRLEYSKEELLGQSVLMVHPEARREEAGVIVAQMLAGTKDFCTVPVISKSGLEIQVETRVYPGVWDGEPALFGVVKDVTKIKQSEEKFSKAFQAGSNLMAISTISSGLYIDVNEMFLHVLEYTRDEVIGKTSQELNIFEDISQREIIKSSIEQNKFAKDIEVKVRTKTGKELIGLFSASNINIGDEPCWLTTMMDITERKEAEKALQRSETLLRSIMDTTSDVIFVKDKECRFVYINPAGCTFNGKTQEELIGYSKADFVTNHEELVKFIADDMRIIEDGITETFEEELIGPDGKLYTFMTTKIPRFDGQGNIIGLIGVAHNITESKKAIDKLEQLTTRLSLATRAGGVGVWDYDLINNILLWDDQMYSLYGISKNKFGNAYEIWKAGFHPDDAVQGEAEIEMAINGEKEFGAEFRVIWPDNSIHTIKALAIIQRDDSGKPIRMIGTNWDITQKKLDQDKLLKAVNAAETANKAKSEFIANMSHEIRTPLNGVIGFTDLLKSTPLSPVQEQYVKNVNASGYTLLGIVNDILDFSKIEAGMLELEFTKTDMGELLSHSVDIIKYTADKKNLEVLLNIDPGMPRFAFVDTLRLKQIFANLMGNAVKFTERGEIELKVIYEDLGNQQGKFNFSVRDTGIGITEEQQKKLFKVFSQADSSTTRRFGGTGLGLVISEMIANKMGSTIQIKSQQGKGSTFYFEIITNVEQGKMIDKTVINTVKSCLIIDDNANNRIILEHTLANWSIDNVSCDNGLDALKIIETTEVFDVVICDYHMPYIDGLETIRMIREKLKLSKEKLPIILLHSSSDDEELHSKCDELGVRFKIIKPVIANELYSCLVKLNSQSSEIEIPEDKEIPNQQQDKIATILIAEDNKVNMMLAKAMITNSFPYVQIIEAINGNEALLFWEMNQPDLILMDIQMPEMNGLEATRQIRLLEKDAGKQTPIIALTAGVLKEEQDNCFNAGIDDYLTKPIDTKLLDKIILKYLSI